MEDNKAIIKRKKRKGFFKSNIFMILGLAFSLTLLIIMGIDMFINSTLNKVERSEQIDIQDAEIHTTIKEQNDAHNVINIMLVGADSDSSKKIEDSFDEERSDALKIISLDYTDKDVKIISLDRDLVVWLPGDSKRYGHFNWAYSYGGPTLSIQTINYNLDLDVTKYISFSFAGFIEVVDQIGGIDIELTKAEAAAFNGVEPTNAVMKGIVAKEGVNHLNGYNALMYARQRYVDSDFVRMNRQNNVIKAIIAKLKVEDYISLLDIVSNSLKYVNTNLTNDEIKKYVIDLLTSFDLNDIQTYTVPKNERDDIYEQKPAMGGYILKSYTGQVEELHKYIYEVDDYECSQTVIDNEINIYDKFLN